MSKFEDLLAFARENKVPPVSDWQPKRVGEIDIRIAVDGRWFHEGSEIKRQPLVTLFATILRLDDDGYCLVTPEEKLRIQVEDAPFLATNVLANGRGTSMRLLFTTNVNDHILADADHAIEVFERKGFPRPYLEVRAGLKALITRNVFYELVNLGDADGNQMSLWSAGTKFVLGPVS